MFTTNPEISLINLDSETAILIFSNILLLIIKRDGDYINSSYVLTVTSNTKLYILKSKEGKSNKKEGKSFYFKIKQNKDKINKARIKEY
jgi:hypothetical protein